MGMPTSTVRCVPDTAKALDLRRNQLAFFVFGEHGVPAGRRIEALQSVKSLSQIAARQLTRAGFHVDIAAEPVQVERQRVDKRLPDILLKQSSFALDV